MTAATTAAWFWNATPCPVPVDDERGGRQARGERGRVHGRDQEVAVAVHDEDGSGRLRRGARLGSTPAVHGGELGAQDGGPGRGLAVVRALAQATQVLARRPPAGGGAREEQQLARVAQLRTGPHRGDDHGARHRGEARAAGRTRPDEHQPVDEVGREVDGGLGHHAAHRQPEQVHGPQPQGVDRGHGVGGHALDGVAGASGRAPDAAVPERDDPPPAGQPVDQPGLPAVERGAEVVEGHQRATRPVPELAVGDAGAVDVDRPRRRVAPRAVSLPHGTSSDDLTERPQV